MWTKVAVLKSAFLIPAATAYLFESGYSTTSTLPITELTLRAREIFRLVVEGYIASGQPVERSQARCCSWSSLGSGWGSLSA